MITHQPEPVDLSTRQRWLRPAQWRQATGMPATTTLLHLREGRLRGVLIGGRWYIEATELSEFFERARTAA